MRGRMREHAAQVLLETLQEAKRGAKMLARVVDAAGTVSRDAPELDRIAQEMQELAFQTWLLAVEARAEASRLARLSGRAAHEERARSTAMGRRPRDQ